MMLTGADLKKRLRGLTDGESLVVEGIEYTSIDGDLHVESSDWVGHLDREDLEDEFEDATVYDVNYTGAHSWG